MKYEPVIHHRRSTRLPHYDYRGPGVYFVTICTQGRECILGEIVEGHTPQSDVGNMVESVWQELPAQYGGVELDAFIVMPNHIHGIIVLVGAGPRARPGRLCRDEPGQPRGVAPTQGLSLPDVVHRFKSLTTAKYRKNVRNLGWPPFAHRLWQRNYYEHIIRDDEDMDRIRAYIAENPARWDEDPENVS